ncbi:MAG TPA: sigma factor, partial [Polyangiales bacterium]|nr:sigma factor [Polyangiales bacterium]
MSRREPAFSPQDVLAHVDALYTFACRLSRSRHVAEDLVQETFARGLANGHAFAPGTNLKAWLFRILRNAFFDLRRREGRSPLRAFEDANADESALAGTPSDAKLDQLRHLVARDVEAALHALTDD